MFLNASVLDDSNAADASASSVDFIAVNGMIEQRVVSYCRYRSVSSDRVSAIKCHIRILPSDA